MTTRRAEVERFSVISSKPFDAVRAAFEAAVGHPDMAEFARAIRSARIFDELEGVIRRGLGKTGLMMFMEFDHGAILRRGNGLDTPKSVRGGTLSPAGANELPSDNNQGEPEHAHDDSS